MLLRLSKSLNTSFTLKPFKNNYFRMFSKANNNDKIVWMDLEMTGLDIKNDKIMEIACLITDKDLNIIAECPQIIIKQEKEDLDKMDKWCTETHKKNGLTAACLNSTTSQLDAENQILNFLSKYTSKNACPLAGNSVYMDRLFMKEHIPKIDEFLHYRIIDVSTIKELCSRWNEDLYKTVPQKKFVHRAIDDIHASINELKFYKKHMFNVESRKA